MVSRLDIQKGVNLLVDTLRALPEMDWQAVILGDGECCPGTINPPTGTGFSPPGTGHQSF
jgi:glycosyltransferase involved in cell wall biosynthesis